MQTVQTKQVVQLLCLLFLNCDLHLIKVCTPFPYSFGNILTPHSKILRGSFEVTLSGKTKSRKFFELVQISSTRQDVICLDRDADLEVRNVLCEQSK